MWMLDPRTITLKVIHVIHIIIGVSVAYQMYATDHESVDVVLLMFSTVLRFRELQAIWKEAKEARTTLNMIVIDTDSDCLAQYYYTQCKPRFSCHQH
jgi:hypothetical protein